MNPLCAAVWVLAVALIPFLVIYRITETEQQKISRLRAAGCGRSSALLNGMGVSIYQVRKSLAAARST